MAWRPSFCLPAPASAILVSGSSSSPACCTTQDPPPRARATYCRPSPRGPRSCWRSSPPSPCWPHAPRALPRTPKTSVSETAWLPPQPQHMHRHCQPSRAKRAIATAQRTCPPSPCRPPWAAAQEGVCRARRGAPPALPGQACSSLPVWLGHRLRHDPLPVAALADVCGRPPVLVQPLYLGTLLNRGDVRQQYQGQPRDGRRLRRFLDRLLRLLLR